MSDFLLPQASPLEAGVMQTKFELQPPTTGNSKRTSKDTAYLSHSPVVSLPWPIAIAA